jgi:outer membrane lipoprotein-sorting protein
MMFSRFNKRRGFSRAISRRASLAWLAVVLCLIAGCEHVEPESIPHFPLMDAQASLQTLAKRAHLVQSLSSQGLVTLTRPNGESIRLDAALVLKPPAEARLRAWKFGRAVFDLTVTPQGVWYLTPDDPARKAQLRSAGVSAAKLAKTWSLLNGGFFNDPALRVEMTPSQLFIRRKFANEPQVLCEVDRATLTPRRYLMFDEKGQQRFSLRLSQYKQFGQIVWPTRITAISDSGKVEVELHDLEMNADLPATAFVPPHRAEKLP